MNRNSQAETSSRIWLRRSAYLAIAVFLMGSGWLAIRAAGARPSSAAGQKASAPRSSGSPSAEMAQPLPTIARSGPDSFIAREIVSQSTEPADFRKDVTTYIVQSGDYLFAIAEKFNIKPETILWSNYDLLKDNPEIIQPGQLLYILPVDGLYYQWQTRDRLDTVASAFGVTPEDIIFWPGNDLPPTIDVQNPGITPGTWLVIPGGHREFKQWEPPVVRSTGGSYWTFAGPGACNGVYSGPAGTGIWSLPTASNWIVGNDYTEYHHGVDLYITMDEPLHAADRGVVVYAGWSTWGYGNLVVVDHGNGWQTIYGHLDRVDVYCGSTVQRGGEIGLGGTTGRSTGPHLHFEMIYNGVRINPHLHFNLR